MTITLKTMLLPTGEFALLVHDTRSEPPSQEYLDTLAGFRAQIGAVGGFISPDEILVEDALFDEKARRVESEEESAAEPTELDAAWQDIGYTEPETDLQPFIEQINRDVAALSANELYFPRAKFGDQTFSVKFTADALPFEFGGPVPADSTTFSPAGLVVDGAKTKAELEPELEDALSGNLERGGPRPGKIDSGVVNPGDPVADQLVEIVKVNGRPSGSQYEGQIGTVVRRQRMFADGVLGWVVQIEGDEAAVWASQVKSVEFKVEYDDLAELDEVAPDYAADSRLVDLVVKVSQAAVESYTRPEIRGSSFFQNGDRLINDPWRRYVQGLLTNGGVNTHLDEED